MFLFGANELRRMAKITYFLLIFVSQNGVPLPVSCHQMWVPSLFLVLKSMYPSYLDLKPVPLVRTKSIICAHSFGRQVIDQVLTIWWQDWVLNFEKQLLW